MAGPEGQLQRTLASVLAEHPIGFSYLFGSVARGEDRDGSDVDVAVHFHPGMPADERLDATLRLGGELERRLRREVDVVDLEDAPLRLQGRILTERIILTGHQSAVRVRFETEVFPRYIDADHHARRLDAEVLAETAAGRR